MIGIDRPMSGRSTVLPIMCLYRSSEGWTATAVSPSIVSGRVVATWSDSPEPATGYLIVQIWPACSTYSISSSATAVRSCTSQLTRRLPR